MSLLLSPNIRSPHSRGARLRVRAHAEDTPWGAGALGKTALPDSVRPSWLLAGPLCSSHWLSLASASDGVTDCTHLQPLRIPSLSGKLTFVLTERLKAGSYGVNSHALGL